MTMSMNVSITAVLVKKSAATSLPIIRVVIGRTVLLNCLVQVQCSLQTPVRLFCTEEQIGKDQETTQSERNSHSINRGVGKK